MHRGNTIVAVVLLPVDSAAGDQFVVYRASPAVLTSFVPKIASYNLFVFCLLLITTFRSLRIKSQKDRNTWLETFAVVALKEHTQPISQLNILSIDRKRTLVRKGPRQHNKGKIIHPPLRFWITR